MTITYGVDSRVPVKFSPGSDAHRLAGDLVQIFLYFPRDYCIDNFPVNKIKNVLSDFKLGNSIFNVIWGGIKKLSDEKLSDKLEQKKFVYFIRKDLLSSYLPKITVSIKLKEPNAREYWRWSLELTTDIFPDPDNSYPKDFLKGTFEDFSRGYILTGPVSADLMKESIRLLLAPPGNKKYHGNTTWLFGVR